MGIGKEKKRGWAGRGKRRGLVHFLRPPVVLRTSQDDTDKIAKMVHESQAACGFEWAHQPLSPRCWMGARPEIAVDTGVRTNLLLSSVGHRRRPHVDIGVISTGKYSTVGSTEAKNKRREFFARPPSLAQPKHGCHGPPIHTQRGRSWGGVGAGSGGSKPAKYEIPPDVNIPARSYSTPFSSWLALVLVVQTLAIGHRCRRLHPTCARTVSIGFLPHRIAPDDQVEIRTSDTFRQLLRRNTLAASIDPKSPMLRTSK